MLNPEMGERIVSVRFTKTDSEDIGKEEILGTEERSSLFYTLAEFMEQNS